MRKIITLAVAGLLALVPATAASADHHHQGDGDGTLINGGLLGIDRSPVDVTVPVSGIAVGPLCLITEYCNPEQDVETSQQVRQ